MIKIIQPNNTTRVTSIKAFTLTVLTFLFIQYGFCQKAPKIDNSLSILSTKNNPEIWIESNNNNAPVLLWIHGEPEVSAISPTNNDELKNHFTIVNWRPSNHTHLNIYNTLEITRQLISEYKTEKIYLMGSSFGSYTAIQAAQKYSQYYTAYIGVNQIINPIESEKALEKCTMDSIPSILEKTDIETYHKNCLEKIKLAHNNVQCKSFCNNLKTGILKRKANSDSTFQKTEFQIPIYFLIGKYDHVAEYGNKVIDGFYRKIDAPFKRIIYFDESGHYPNLEEPEKFGKELTRLTQSYLADFMIPGNKGYVISPFGPRHWRMHYGTDLKMYLGDTVKAVESGKIIRSNWGTGFGRLVVIQHAHTIQTYYAHLSKFLVTQGEWVEKGQAIGLAGRSGRATGVHLHFELHENNKAYDSELVFDFKNQTIRNVAKQEESLLAIHKLLKPQGYGRNTGVPEYYKVRSGDSLWAISRKFKTPMKKLCQLNKISENSVLRIGQALKLY